ncbi:MAG: PilZ domain-containing protein, partial [Deltaproteobacteria bacterium]|nr:PilZ domain-containing protein [Deltaproteobacteria bacterium]
SEEEFLKKKEQYVNEIIPDWAVEMTDPGLYPDADSENEYYPISKKLTNELSLLNRKFYAFQKLMFQSEEIDIFEQKPVKVNMSGSGIRFSTDQYCQVGDLLDIKMVLPTSPFLVIKVIGLVLRINRTSQHSSLVHHRPSLAVKYLAIHEDSREAIIKCVFTWLRQSLREMKRAH